MTEETTLGTEAYQDLRDGGALRRLREAAPEPGVVSTFWTSRYPDEHEVTFESDRVRCGEAAVSVNKSAPTIAEAADAVLAGLVEP